MTDREAMELALEALNQATGMCAERTSTRRDIDEAITALRQTLEQPSDSVEQEPVNREVLVEGIAGSIIKHMTVSLYPSEVLAAAAYIANNYTAPPKREWVGLTDEEIITYFQTNVDTGSLLSYADGARYAEAKLKEKNT